MAKRDRAGTGGPPGLARPGADRETSPNFDGPRVALLDHVNIRLRFDRGTLLVEGPEAALLPGVVWDERTQNLRATAHRYHALASRADDDPLPARWARRGVWRDVALRTYQRDALEAWLTAERRGITVLPTGAGKTRIALAAAASVRRPTVILCPTRVLLGQWVTTLGEFYEGAVGAVGDGESRVEDVTVMTFESAFRRMDSLGDRFALVVVDEVHHFASGLRGEALEACAAPYRLGLTATAPERGSSGEDALRGLVGPPVFSMSIGDLSGSHLAEFDVVHLRVSLESDERLEYARLTERFFALRAELRDTEASLDWQATMRAMSRTGAGRLAIADWQRAIALAGFPREKQRLAATLIDRHRADKTLVFAALAADARAISCASLVPAITAEIGRDERDAILERFRDGRMRCIATARVLNEGVDVPDASVAIVLGGALGVREQIQRVGRVLRPAPGKRAIVYDVATAQTVDADRADRKWRRFAAASLRTVPA